jgi:hypothetical protein
MTPTYPADIASCDQMILQTRYQVWQNFQLQENCLSNTESGALLSEDQSPEETRRKAYQQKQMPFNDLISTENYLFR